MHQSVGEIDKQHSSAARNICGAAVYDMVVPRLIRAGNLQIVGFCSHLSTAADGDRQIIRSSAFRPESQGELNKVSWIQSGHINLR